MSRAQKIMDMLQIKNNTIETTAAKEGNNIEIIPMEYYETIHIIPLSSPYEVISSDDNVLMNDSQHEGSYNISVRPQLAELSGNNIIETIDRSSNYENLVKKPLFSSLFRY